MRIEELRNEINKTDKELLSLFLKRMELAGFIGAEKARSGLPVQNLGREKEILYNMSVSSPEEMRPYVRNFFSMLFDISKAYQQSHFCADKEYIRSLLGAMRETAFPSEADVACQGIEGAYSGIAAETLFKAVNITYMKNFEGVFSSVESGLCKYGVLPVDNSTAGSVSEVYSLMQKYKCYIVRSVKLRINHVLLAKKGAALENIREIISHEQAINQCSEFLKKHPKIKVTVCENTAEAAKFVADSGRDDIAAISSQNCALLFGLSSICQNIQNSDNNYTRFICISKNLEIYDGAEKISLVLSTENKAGALYSVLSKFAVSELNLTKLESRPIAGTDFEFLFYLDIEASLKDEKTQNLLSELSASQNFTFLGNYSEI